MRKVVICVVCFMTANFASAQNAEETRSYINLVQMRVEEDVVVTKGNIPSRAPMRHPSIGIDGNTLYLYGQFGDLTLQLVGNDGVVEYSMPIAAGANEVVLPEVEAGVYDLKLDDGRFVYSCEINLY